MSIASRPKGGLSTVDECIWIADLEQADAGRLSALLRTATSDTTPLLEQYFGRERLDCLRALATMPNRREARARGGPRGNVVILPGLMGSTLRASNSRESWNTRVWLNPWSILRGGLGYLSLAEDGHQPADPAIGVEPAGILMRYYGELLLSLGRNWNAHAFWYDWRLDIEATAGRLRERVDAWFGPDAPFHLVAHSMGGLVARAFVKKHADRWHASPPSEVGGRLVMLGTPNHGAYLIPQALTGLARTCRLLAKLDLHHDRDGLLDILDTFPGPYQMLPSPRIVPAAERLYRASSYNSLPVSQRHLDRARACHDWLADVVEPQRMMHLAGFGQPTVVGLSGGGHGPLDRLDSYVITRAGDGSVPLALGPLRNPDSSASAVPTYYFPIEHSALTSNKAVLTAVDEALRTGACNAATRPAPERLAIRTYSSPVESSLAVNDPEARRLWLAHNAADLRRARKLIAELITHGPIATHRQRQLELERELASLIGGEWHGGRPTSPDSLHSTALLPHLAPQVPRV